ncbi:gliding motility-associated C-terminal domain-containing protein [Flavobacterium sp. KJJ]|uniref:gliding motility-associated C-terminal domain-containing protein n=1 Tax=Flavobacterium sp. KJJ TaxID=1270193 RepID=UPI00068B0941|nr:gliding motility-associated C-terminal domain-containing protein [Flavobacterium sp. KJJ]
MKNKNLYNVKLPAFRMASKKCSYCALGLFAGLFSSYKVNAQMVNNGDVKVDNNTILSIYMDYENASSGKFINDGEVYVFQNWKNDGVVGYNTAANGKTFFIGEQDQILEGGQPSGFQNIIFNNLNSPIPFHLATTFSVNKEADFKKGIVDADDYDGLVVFNENAVHKNTGDQSFVDGKVQKKGQKMFEFPVGDGQFYRPSIHAANSSVNNLYTTQYFNKNSGNQYPHTSKESGIQLINDKEYWEVRQNEGDEKIVLSLTLDTDTTPSDFFTQTSGTELAIVRWDETTSKWVREGGVLSNEITGETYSHLLTGPVKGYGIFTMAIVTKKNTDKDDLIVYNAITPNGDGINDSFHIEGINKYPENKVEIYNRWGVKVYEANSYNETDVMFRGYSDGRVTINRGDKLPTGTYFYILSYKKETKMVEKSGYLYINNQ